MVRQDVGAIIIIAGGHSCQIDKDLRDRFDYTDYNEESGPSPKGLAVVLAEVDVCLR